MFEPSTNFYTNVIQKQVRRISFNGTIKDTNGTSYNFDSTDISASGNGKIINEIAEGEMEIGTVFASELQVGLLLDSIGIPKANIYDAIIELNCTISSGNASGVVPMGKFKVVEAKQNGKITSVTAYDLMILFDKEFPVTSGANTPYEWAFQFCSECGAALGMTETEIKQLPNGSDVLSLVWIDKLETYRDALGQLAAAIGCSAHMNRRGQLVFMPLKNKTSVATITANDRFDSDLAQASWNPSSIFATNSESGNVTKRGNGSLMLDLGENGFLQAEGKRRNLAWEIVSTDSVSTMINNILTVAHELTVVPVEAEIPFDPCLDLFDIVTLAGGQANNIKTLITSIEHTLNASTTIKCAGANKTDEPNDSSKSGSDRTAVVWMTGAISDRYIEIGTGTITWGSLSASTWQSLNLSTWGDLFLEAVETEIVNTNYFAQKEFAKGVISFSVNYNLTEDAKITYRLYKNDEIVWKTVENQKAGKIVKTITSPVSVWSRTEGTYNLKATMKGEDDS